jgi:hypothetical protein
VAGLQRWRRAERRQLADAGRLGDVQFVSSVSGGSIANGLLACAWNELKAEDFSSDAVDARVIDPCPEPENERWQTSHFSLKRQ